MTELRGVAQWSVLRWLSTRAVAITGVCFLLVLSSQSHGVNPSDALAPVEIVATGFREPTGIAIDPNGSAYVSDRAAGILYRVTSSTLERVRSGLKAPVGLAFDHAGRLLVVEETGGRLIAIDGATTTVLAQGLKRPRWVAVGGDGSIYVSAQALGRQAGATPVDPDDDEDDAVSGKGQVIIRVDPAGHIAVWADGFKGLESVLVGDGAILAVANGRGRETAALYEVAVRPDGASGAVTRLSSTVLNTPLGLARDALGAVYTSSKVLGSRTTAASNAIGKVGEDGTVTLFAPKLALPRGIAFDAAGNLYVVDGTSRTSRLLRFVAPAPPTVTSSGFANQSPAVLLGQTAANARVDVVDDDEIVGTAQAGDGAFAVSTAIELNTVNAFSVYATAQQGRGLTSAPANVTIVHDAVGPSISALQPPTGSFRNIAQPAMSATFADAVAGIDVSSVSIRVDGVAVTGQAQVSASGFTLTPSALAEGSHTLAVQIADRAGNTAAASSTFVVDLTAPSITGLQPESGSTVNGTRPSIVAAFSDALAGVNATTARIVLDGVDRTANATIANTGLTLDPGTLGSGAHTWSVTVNDFAGNVATVNASFTISTSPPGGSFPPDPVTVAPSLNPSVPTNPFTATEFLYTGPNAIQTGVTEGAIEPARVAVVRGRVRDRAGQPVGGVRVSVLNSSVLGQTSSRADGMFDLAVNGGETVTVKYELAGFLPVQRSIGVQAHEFGTVPDVVMVPYDTQVTPVDLTASVPIQVARGNVVSDALGTRQPTLFFRQGTTAMMRLPGGRQQALTALNVRATEYTVGPTGLSALPGSLPANVAFVSSTEYTIDEAVAAGALEVRFNQPVINYVENIVGIPTGDAVPLATYDRERAVWVPEQDGVAIAILGISGGLAQVDTNGDGIADDGASVGMTDAERQHLATLYQPGQTLTRRLLNHFSPFG